MSPTCYFSCLIQWFTCVETQLGIVCLIQLKPIESLPSEFIYHQCTLMADDWHMAKP